jgi:hypothetical protein
MLSVICPIYNEQKYIIPCIDSIIAQDYPKDDIEVLFVDGMSTDNTRSIVTEYSVKYPFIHLLDNPHKIVPYAMNTGIKAAKGDTIIRLDAHAEYPDNYFSEVTGYLNKLEGAENVGGVCVTLPCNKSSMAIAIAEALSSTFGMGNSYFRTGSKDIKSVDTVPFGCFRAGLFDRIGYYDNELIRNQDDELNGRIIKNGGKIYLIPDIRIKYFARDKVKKIWNMFYQYGLYKPLVNRKLGSPATIRQFFPLLFVTGLALGLLLSFISKYLLTIYIFVITIYILIGIFTGIKISLKHKRFALALIMPYLFFIIHISYGIGYLNGIFKILCKKPFNAESNR